MIRIFLTILFFTSVSHAETWKVVTLDWPPYTMEDAPDHGAAAKAFTEMMATVGVKVEYLFLPWTRGVKEVQKPEFVGLFPVWDGENFPGRKNSQQLISSPITFVQHKNRLHPWKRIEDFKGLKIGVVDGYDYPKKILELGEKKFYHLSIVGTDEQNLRMLNFNRIDVTVADYYNAKYLIENRFPELRENLVIDPKIYKKAGLFISLKADATYPGRVAKIERALKNMPMQPRIDKLMTEVFSKVTRPETKKRTSPP